MYIYIYIYIYIYNIYMSGCCLRGQNMVKEVSLRGRKIKGNKKVSP